MLEVKLRLENYSDDSDNFQLFGLHTDDFFGYKYHKKITFQRKYTELVHLYLQKHEHCFTLLPGCIEGHFLTILIYKNSEGIHM